MQHNGGSLPESRHFRLQQVAGGVYAAIASAGTGAVANAGIIDLGDRTLVFDAMGTPQAARDLRTAAEALTGRPVAYVINSHFHGDHVFGNQTFAPETDIIAATPTRELMATRTADMLEQARAAAPASPPTNGQYAQDPGTAPQHEANLQAETDREFAFALPTLQLRLPNQTFEQRMVFYGAHRTAEVITYGGGHTGNDAFLYLPGARIAFMGDLLSTRTHPWLGDGDPEEWIRILQQVEMLDLAIAVPGHGPVGTGEDLALLRQYITDLLRVTSSVVGGGKSASEAAGKAIPAPFNTWDGADVFAHNMRFLHGHLARG